MNDDAAGQGPHERPVGRPVDEATDTSGPRGTYGCACLDRDSVQCAAIRYGMDHYGDAPRQPVFELRSDAESGVQVASVTKGRVRADDMRRLHQQAADRVRAALIEADYWTKELLRLGNHVERAENDLQDTIDRRQRLRVPNPLFPVEKM